MAILIDDAGWGSPVLGTIIGGYRTETGQAAFSNVPVELFQGKAFSRKVYLQGAVSAARSVLAELGYQPEDKIVICTGHVLEGIREYLAGSGRKWETGKIVGPFQDLIETKFLEELKAAGVKGVNLDILTQKHGLFFWLCVKWLKGGDLNASALPEREKLAKTGWETYQFWGPLPYEQAKVAAKRYKTSRSRERLYD
jgi:hypothetical protein